MEGQKTARKIRDVAGWQGNVSLYEMTPIFKGHRFVFISGVNLVWAYETMMFPAANADAKEPMDWDGLACARNTTNHTELLAEIGYTLAE